MERVVCTVHVSWTNQSHQHHWGVQQYFRCQQPRPFLRKRLSCSVCVGLSKQGERFLSSVATSTTNENVNRLIRKFVGSSPKPVALDALSHLLSPHTTHPHLSSIAFPLYSEISEAPWFDWNPKLVAQLVALLEKQGRYDESATLLSESISKLQSKERDLLQFYCNLIESHSKHNAFHGFDDSFSRLNQLVSDSNSFYVKKQGYKAMISGLCEMGSPREAEDLIGEMRGKGLKASLFEFRCVLYGYGKLGLFQDMHKTLQEMESQGLEVDTVCSNMILSSYGAHNAHSHMIHWLQKMKTSGIPFSLRTYNSVLNSCPTIMSIISGIDSHHGYPISFRDLMEVLNEDEALLIKELVESSVLSEAIKWSNSEAKLDLHGMHLASAYVVMLQWMEELRNRSIEGKQVFPTEITVVCGSGKHSSIRGESPIKCMVKELVTRRRSPLRIDRKNTGCFVAKGKAIIEWLQ
ncbi:hypothetical protein K2173_012552 [Erythroxylum novogranatense]|uniref:Smr domain-containing protein n=1 Tax=Erythroxylum novogranatense TaxID=1862640 RepID=A0AAV8TKU3_9ROSI|nr:hypothetical protein K2173_012552 [Erythroxylum novogranatense]